MSLGFGLIFLLFLVFCSHHLRGQDDTALASYGEVGAGDTLRARRGVLQTLLVGVGCGEGAGFAFL